SCRRRSSPFGSRSAPRLRPPPTARFFSISPSYHPLCQEFIASCCFIWRRGWDSNPRGACAPAGFQDRCIRPLCHLSEARELGAKDAIKLGPRAPAPSPRPRPRGFARPPAPRRQYRLIPPVKELMSTRSATAHSSSFPISRRTRRRRPSRFIRNIVILIALLHVSVGIRLLPALPIATPGRVLGALALCASFVLIITGARARMLQSSSFAANLAWLGSLNGGFFSSLAVLTMGRDLFLGPAVLFASRGEAATLEAASAIAVPLLAVLATVVGFI